VRAFLLLSILVLGSSLGAQARPDLDWRTITTPRFRVHFTPELEELARRTAANADSAYTRLARELTPPRGLIEIIVTDHLDWSNGSATPFPSNRIVVHARPPVDELSLRNHEDWNLSLVTHELTHIFQLDRANGWWGVARRVFGRAPPFFPNSYAPSWLIEGVAVHYETRFTRGGRLAGTEFPAHARALAAGDALPPINGLALPSPFFPGGNNAYQFGAFLVRRTAEHDGDVAGDTAAAMTRLIDRMSSRVNPWRLNASAREAVGATFSELYASWSDSVRRAVVTEEASEAGTPTRRGVETLVAAAWTARFPRFLPSGEIIYVVDDRRRNPAVHQLTADGTVRRLDRRNSIDANVPLADGRILRGDLEATNPYSVQSDLFVGEGFSRRRLTRGARLAHPDVHAASGRIVAVRTIAATTELVTLSLDDRTPRPLVAGTLDSTWSEPRWSPSGTRIAAALWERGGRASIVILDATGGALQRFSPRSASDDRLVIASAPAWFPGDTMIAFVSDHEGAPQIYRGDVRTGAYQRVWTTSTALNTPDVSLDGTQIVAVELRAEGWAVVRLTLADGGPFPPLDAGPPERDLLPLPPLAPAATNDRPMAQTFDARQTMQPSWWLPSVTISDDNTAVVGAFTSSRDAIGRHAWGVAVARDLGHPEFTARATYSYAGLRNPSLTFDASQEWAHGAVTSGGSRIGTLAQRSVTLRSSALFSRPRFRNFTYLLLAADVEYQSFRTYPIELISAFPDPELMRITALPRFTSAVGFSTMQRPGLSVSVEDGVAVDAYYRHRVRDGIDGAAVGETVVRASVAKSLPLPGFARHVIAARAAVGHTDPDARSPFSIGGVSGSSIELLPGVSFGDTQRSFFVRGFDPAHIEAFARPRRARSTGCRSHELGADSRSRPYSCRSCRCSRSPMRARRGASVRSRTRRSVRTRSNHAVGSRAQVVRSCSTRRCTTTCCTGFD